jgi:hypothetical protein
LANTFFNSAKIAPRSNIYKEKDLAKKNGSKLEIFYNNVSSA